MSIETDDTDSLKLLKQSVDGRKVLIIAPGVSVNKYRSDVCSFINKEQPLIITVHCQLDEIKADYEFFTSIKRYDLFQTNNCLSEKIITSNLTRYENVDETAIVVSYGRLAYHNGIFSDDSVLMLLNLLKSIGVMQLSIAGFDGFDFTDGNFYIEGLSRSADKEKSDNVKNILTEQYNDMNIDFLTPSYYENYKNT